MINRMTQEYQRSKDGNTFSVAQLNSELVSIRNSLKKEKEKSVKYRKLMLEYKAEAEAIERSISNSKRYQNMLAKNKKLGRELIHQQQENKSLLQKISLIRTSVYSTFAMLKN